MNPKPNEKTIDISYWFDYSLLFGALGIIGIMVELSLNTSAYLSTALFIGLFCWVSYTTTQVIWTDSRKMKELQDNQRQIETEP